MTVSNLPSFLAGEPPSDEELWHSDDWVSDDRRAEYAMRRLIELNEQRDGLRAQRDEWIEQIQAWCDDASLPAVNESIRLEQMLRHYAKAERARDDRKTIKLPSGTLSTVGGGEPVVDIVDAKAVLVWATADPSLRDALIRPKDVLVSELRKVVTIRETEDGDRYVVARDGGDLVPGVEVTEPEVLAHIRPR